MAVGLAATMVISVLFALGLALVDDRIYDRDDIERLGMVPLIGVVPRASKERQEGEAWLISRADRRKGRSAPRPIA